MLILANTFTGKNEAIINLDINGFLVNSKFLLNCFFDKKYEILSDCVSQIVNAEPHRIILCNYVNKEFMARIFNNISNERIICCGFDVDYIPTLTKSPSYRYRRELTQLDNRGNTITKGYLASKEWFNREDIIKDFNLFKQFREVYTDSLFIQLQPNQFLHHVLAEPLKEYRGQPKESLFEVSRKYPLIF